MKTLNLPYEEYQADLLDMRKQGFNHALRMVGEMLKLPENERFEYLSEKLDADAYEVAKKLGIKIPDPDFKESDIPF